MEYFKLNITDFTPSSNIIPGNLNSTSELSLGTEGNSLRTKGTQDSGKPMTGGFLWSSSKTCDDNNQKAILAASQGKHDTVQFMLDNDMISDLSACDKNGNTLLHYLVKNATDEKDKTLCNVLKMPYIGNVVCVQNNDGDTPLHVCVKTGNMLLANRLVALGADKSIRNNKNQYISSESSSEDCECDDFDEVGNRRQIGDSTPTTEEFLNKVFGNVPEQGQQMGMYQVEYMSQTQRPGLDRDSDFNEQAEDPINKVFAQETYYEEQEFREPKMQMEQGQQAPITFERLLGGTNKYDLGTETEGMINDVVQHYNGLSRQGEEDEGLVEELEELDVEELDVEELDVEEEEKSLDGGSDVLNTDDQIGSAINKIDHILELNKKRSRNFGRPSLGMYGGGRKVSSSKGNRNKKDIGRQNANELSRLIKNQSKEIHKRVTRNIGEMMHIGGSEAKLYKNALYRSVIKKNKHMSSDLDRAVELEKSLSKKAIKSLDIEGFIKERNSSRNNYLDTISSGGDLESSSIFEKATNKNDGQKDDDRKYNTISATSSAVINTDMRKRNFSDTSFSETEKSYPVNKNQKRYEVGNNNKRLNNDTISMTSSDIIGGNNNFSDTSFSVTEKSVTDKKKKKFDGFVNSIDSLSSSGSF